MKKHTLTFLCLLLYSFVTAQSEFINIFKPDTSLKSNAKADKARLKVFDILQLQNYEPNLIGYTFDSDDKPFLDFTFSASTNVFPFHYLVKLVPTPYRPDLQMRFAFTVRFGQYIGTRYSNPVIEKRFNPYLFLQYKPKNKTKHYFIRAGYGHESNGQSIDDSLTFFTIASLPHNDVNQTKDHISRGWDYLALSLVTNQFPKGRSKFIMEETISLKYYMNTGLLQGKKEEYHSWEGSWSGSSYPRNKISGLALSASCFVDSSFINKIQVSYETGIERPFGKSSIAITAGLKFGDFPFSLSYKYGYGGDLAQYGKLNNSFNIAIIIPAFETYTGKK